MDRFHLLSCSPIWICCFGVRFRMAEVGCKEAFVVFKEIGMQMFGSLNDVAAASAAASACGETDDFPLAHAVVVGDFFARLDVAQGYNIVYAMIVGA